MVPALGITKRRIEPQRRRCAQKTFVAWVSRPGLSTSARVRRPCYVNSILLSASSCLCGSNDSIPLMRRERRIRELPRFVRRQSAARIDRLVPHAYPLMLDVTGRLVVIVGGGAVAVRKVDGLLAAGATRVRVVSPVFHAEMPLDDSRVERVAAAYESRHLDGAALVFAATDLPEVNAAVVRDARSRGILVNRA